MLAINENPKLDLETLQVIRSKVNKNIETIDDYEKLDYWISSIISEKYILNELKKNGFSSYELFNIEREHLLNNTEYRNRNEYLDRLINGTLHGMILGVISSLEDRLLYF